jgi:hypothetical protein
MAFSNTYDVNNPGSAVSNREDLTDVLTILAPEETPVLSSAQKQRAVATSLTFKKLLTPLVPLKSLKQKLKQSANSNVTLKQLFAPPMLNNKLPMFFLIR